MSVIDAIKITFIASNKNEGKKYTENRKLSIQSPILKNSYCVIRIYAYESIFAFKKFLKF
jgi:hypothetical protein